VCEICGQGFQRDQNLQMHRRRHKVPWKLLKREAGEAARKRVFLCPEPSCLHHDPSHALGDLVGIKKHFRRKHSGHRQWACVFSRYEYDRSRCWWSSLILFISISLPLRTTLISRRHEIINPAISPVYLLRIFYSCRDLAEE
jgi:hypothetical protein